MAPEILMEKGYGKEVDWWSVGVIMYECLVGYAPFSCEDTTETCLMILDWKTTLEFPREANLSPEAVDLMTKYVLGGIPRPARPRRVFRGKFVRPTAHTPASVLAGFSRMLKTELDSKRS
jgi:serine/threonine protein kinase